MGMRMGAPLGMIVGLALAACHPAGSIGPDTVGSEQGRTDLVVVRPDQFGQTITLTASQTLSVPRPVDVDEWHVSFAAEVLELLMTPDQARRPGPAGWRFRPAAAGETALVFTTVPPVCPPDTPCPPQPPPRQFSLTVRVSR